MALKPGFFGLDDWYAPRSKAGEPPKRLAEVVIFGAFRQRSEKAPQWSQTDVVPI